LNGLLARIEHQDPGATEPRGLARQAGLGRYQLIRVSSGYRVDPHAYLLNARVNRGRQLLREGLALAEVAYQLGFADQSHFQRVFKAHVGVTPGQYRETEGLQVQYSSIRQNGPGSRLRFSAEPPQWNSSCSSPPPTFLPCSHLARTFSWWPAPRPAAVGGWPAAPAWASPWPTARSSSSPSPGFRYCSGQRAVHRPATGGASYLLYIGVLFLRHAGQTSLGTVAGSQRVMAGGQPGHGLLVRHPQPQERAVLCQPGQHDRQRQRRLENGLRRLDVHIVLLWDLLVAVAIGNQRVLRRFARSLPWLERASGVMLVMLAGALLLHLARG
jgi:AraC-like DNA-binding protein